MRTADRPSIDCLRQALRYENGRLFWLNRPADHFSSIRDWSRWNSTFSGKEAGSIRTQRNKSRNFVSLFCVDIQRSVLVWALHHGEWVTGLDHKDGDSLNDKIENLRIATQRQNCANSRKRRNSKNEYKGAHWRKRSGKWTSKICVNYKQIHLGYFDDPEEAHEAYLAAAEKYHGEFANRG